MTCGIEWLNPEHDAEWDRQLTSFPAASFFHTRAWMRVLTSSYGFLPTYLRSVDTSGTRAMLPLMEVNSWLTGRRGVALPFTDKCELLAVNASDFGQAISAVNAHAVERKWKYWEIRGNRSVAESRAPSASYLGHDLNLHRDEPSLFEGLTGGVRGAIRKAEREGVSVEVCHNVEAMHTFYGLLCKTRQRHGVPPQPFRFFENIQRHIVEPHLGSVFVARHRDTPIAAAVYFHFGRDALFKFGASDDHYQHLRGNSLVMWRAIAWHAERGFQRLDFGRTSVTNLGLRRFKLAWGAREFPINYLRLDPATKNALPIKDNSAGWHTSLFRLLPGPIARAVGSALYCHMA